jgi:hypothetical protein
MFVVPPTLANDFPTRTREEMIYNVWCRQDALYWGALVGEDMQVRVSIGMYDLGNGDGPVINAQPEVKILKSWYFFKMEPYRDKKSHMRQLKLVIISMPKKSTHTWKKMYHMSWVEFALTQNTWMVQKNGETLEYGQERKDWTKKFNWILKMLRGKTK